MREGEFVIEFVRGPRLIGRGGEFARGGDAVWTLSIVAPGPGRVEFDGAFTVVVEGTAVGKKDVIDEELTILALGAGRPSGLGSFSSPVQFTDMDLR